MCRHFHLSVSFVRVQWCFTATEISRRTVTNVRDGEPRTATSTFTQLLTSVSFGCSDNIYTREALFPLNLRSSGRGRVGSLFTNEEQNKVGSWRIWYFCHTCQPRLWRHWQTAGHKMAALTVVSLRLSDIDFDVKQHWLKYNNNNNGHFYGAWSLARSRAQCAVQKAAEKCINTYNGQNKKGLGPQDRQPRKNLHTAISVNKPKLLVKKKSFSFLQTNQ